MMIYGKDLKTLLSDKDIQKNLYKGLFGIEKENIRISPEGEIAKTPHPPCFGDKNTHPYITTDFAESQVEMITPPLPTILEAHGFMETIHDIFSENIGDELLWPQSFPPRIRNENDISIASYGNQGADKELYRESIAHKYGKSRLLISGVHFNMSLSEDFIKLLWTKTQSTVDYHFFKDDLYMRMVRNFMRHRWLLIYLFGKSPVSHPSYQTKRKENSKTVASVVCPESVSLRNSRAGYRNWEDFYINYTSPKTYKQSIDKLIAKRKLMFGNELYHPIRLKFDSKNRLSHLEIRLIDLSPFVKTGVCLATLHFIHLFMIYALVEDETDVFSKKEQQIASNLHDNISCYGKRTDFLIQDTGTEPELVQVVASKLYRKIKDIATKTKIHKNEYYGYALERAERFINQAEMRPAYKINEAISKEGYIGFHLAKAKEYKAMSLNKGYRMHRHEDLELSTQLLLKAAIKKGVHFEIVDRKENFVKLWNNNKTEYVMQATRTSLDPYNSILMMGNKLVTKKVLQENNIRVPEGGYYTTKEQALADFFLYKNKGIVVKPKSTNFGVGITVLKENSSRELYATAIETAFNQDNSILVETFVKGKEYRMFIINNKVVGILHRVPANVCGNGKDTIAQLIDQKNKNPLRGKGYKTPLEKIEKGEAEQIFLSTQNLDFNTVPQNGQLVYLRENSNISTGGDSIDCTNDLHSSYNDIAIQAARALNVKITGLDMMIEDIKSPATKDNYAIIEMNYNPAIHIHCYPLVGKNRKLNELILDALGF